MLIITIISQKVQEAPNFDQIKLGSKFIGNLIINLSGD